MKRNLIFLLLALSLCFAACDKDPQPNEPADDGDPTLCYEVEGEQYILLTQESGQRWLFQVMPSNNAVLVNHYSHGYNYAVMNAQFSYRDEYKGDLVIPESFSHNGMTYTVAKIEDCAFECCDYLNSITIPNTINYLGQFVFHTCFGLRNVELPPTLDSISHQCFFGCESLQTIQFPESLKYIGVLAFYNSGLKELHFKKNIIIDEQAFANCKELVTVSLPDGIDTINDAFSCCENLSSVFMPQSVKVIGAQAFSYTNLSSVDFPDALVRIEEYAFSHTPLTSIELPKTLQCLNGFDHCPNLSEVTCLATAPPQIEYDDVFSESPLTVIYVPGESVDAYKSANGWCDYADIIQPMP